MFEVYCEDLFQMQGQTFDRIMIYNAYPHFMEKEKLVKKVEELLNPGGRFVVAHGACREKKLMDVIQMYPKKLQLVCCLRKKKAVTGENAFSGYADRYRAVLLVFWGEIEFYWKIFDLCPR